MQVDELAARAAGAKISEPLHLLDLFATPEDGLLQAVFAQCGDVRTLLRCEAVCRDFQRGSTDAACRRKGSFWHQLCVEAHPECDGLADVSDYRALLVRWAARSAPKPTAMHLNDLQFVVTMELRAPRDMRGASEHTGPEHGRALGEESVKPSVARRLMRKHVTFHGADAGSGHEQEHWKSVWGAPDMPIGLCWPADDFADELVALKYFRGALPPGITATAATPIIGPYDTAYQYDQPQGDGPRYEDWVARARMLFLTVTAFRKSDQKVCHLLRDAPIRLRYETLDPDYLRFGGCDVNCGISPDYEDSRLRGIDSEAFDREFSAEKSIAGTKIAVRAMLAPSRALPRQPGVGAETASGWKWNLHLRLTDEGLHEVSEFEEPPALSTADMVKVLGMARWE